MYLFHRVIEVVFPPVDADSNIDTSEFSVQELLEESVNKNKKKFKQKVGFRDRKVLSLSAITKCIIINIIIIY